MEETTGAPSSFAALSPRRLRASSRDGGRVVNRPPSSPTMLLSGHTRRRDFFIGSCACTLNGAAASAQSVQQSHRVAFVHSALPTERLLEKTGPFWVQRFFQELRRAGFVEGENLRIERFSAMGSQERHALVAQQIAAYRPTLIVANSNLLIRTLRAATGEVPIIGILGDPLSYRTVSNLARPEGSITGVSIDAGLEVTGKRLQVLKEVKPEIRTVASLAIPADWEGAGGDHLRRAAHDLGVTVHKLAPESNSGTGIRQAFQALQKHQPDALLVSASGEWIAIQESIVEFAREHNLPAIYPYRDFVEVGGLMAYAPDLAEMALHLATTTARFLRGARAEDVPIQQATKFALIVNLATAKALDLTIPPTLLARADEVIE